ncbi:inactive transglutaminase family protein [Legionella sp. W05-934-2]|uniref:inactive transglutaminase family protein n=1 Tax=Legionella sp. W05-934-2 TaxID=1198649 RepID=UPI003461B9F3
MKKHTNHHLYGLIVVLTVLGLSMFYYRHFVLQVPLTDTETVNSWTVEATLHFQAENKVPVKASFPIPFMPPNFAILDEYFVSPNYGVTTNLVNNNRQTVWSQRRAHGSQSLYYRGIFRAIDQPDFPLGKPAHVKVLPLDAKYKPAVDSMLEDIRKSSADVLTFAQSAIKAINRKDDNAKLLVSGDFSQINVIKAVQLLLNQASIPSKLVRGLQLAKNSESEFKYYLAVYQNKKWTLVNPINGSAGIPEQYLVWQYGDEPAYMLSGGKKASFNLSVTPTPVNALFLAKKHALQNESTLLRFSLLQLPLTLQQTYRILLTVPLGAFIILLLRNFIGLKTFGTFMPVLIALAFRETHLVWGITLFVLIVSFGLLARFYLDQLRLLLVPRLASILTVVILMMIFISILSQNLGLDLGLSVALFPMVILTMTIERMCIVWDERGPAEAIKSGMGSLLAAVIAYGAMNYEPLQYLLFAFPELLLVLLALILLFGQYRGYRLFELFRFKSLARN